MNKKSILLSLGLTVALLLGLVNQSAIAGQGSDDQEHSSIAPRQWYSETDQDVAEEMAELRGELCTNLYCTNSGSGGYIFEMPQGTNNPPNKWAQRLSFGPDSTQLSEIVLRLGKYISDPPSDVGATVYVQTDTNGYPGLVLATIPLARSEILNITRLDFRSENLIVAGDFWVAIECLAPSRDSGIYVRCDFGTNNDGGCVDGSALIRGSSPTWMYSWQFFGSLPHDVSLRIYGYHCWETGCCVYMTGDLAGPANVSPDISDLTALVNHLFVTLDPLDCAGEANMNGDDACSIDISDLTALINNLFITFEDMPLCGPGCS
ncbi:MAG: hypothetical protein V3T31_07660 [candidate division Zixibacteria bacterium]